MLCKIFSFNSVKQVAGSYRICRESENFACSTYTQVILTQSVVFSRKKQIYLMSGITAKPNSITILDSITLKTMYIKIILSFVLSENLKFFAFIISGYSPKSQNYFSRLQKIRLINKSFFLIYRKLASYTITGDKNIWFWQLNDPGLEQYDYVQDARLFFMSCDAWLLENDFLAEEDIVIMDAKDITLKFITKFNISVARKLSKYQEVSGIFFSIIVSLFSVLLPGQDLTVFSCKSPYFVRTLAMFVTQTKSDRHATFVLVYLDGDFLHQVSSEYRSLPITLTLSNTMKA